MNNAVAEFLDPPEPAGPGDIAYILAQRVKELERENADLQRAITVLLEQTRP